MKTKTIATSAVLSALSIILVMVLHFPIFPAAPFLEYDPADIPIFIGAFMFGPTVGIVITIIVSVLQGLTVSGGSGIIGIFMHICATGSFVFVSGLIYRKWKSVKGLITANVIGVIVWIATMAVWNILLTPLFTGTPRQAVINMLLPVIIPFNLIKAGINATLAVLLFLAIRPRIAKKSLDTSLTDYPSNDLDILQNVDSNNKNLDTSINNNSDKNNTAILSPLILDNEKIEELEHDSSNSEVIDNNNII